MEEGCFTNAAEVATNKKRYLDTSQKFNEEFWETYQNGQ